MLEQRGLSYFIVYLSILRNLTNSDKLQSHGLSIHALFLPSENGGRVLFMCGGRHMVNYHFQDRFYIKSIQNACKMITL